MKQSSSPDSAEHGKYVLYGARASMYTLKLQCYLGWKEVPFDGVTASLKLYRDFIVPRTGVRFIPVLQTPENSVWQDTAVIIERLEARFPGRSVLPASPRQRMAALLLELYGDEWILMFALYYRYAHQAENMRHLSTEFGKTLFPALPAFLQRMLGARVPRKFSALLPRLGITEATAPALEAGFASLLDDLEAHLSTTPYLLGARPTLGDFAFYGHFAGALTFDPAAIPVVNDRAPAILDWLKRMGTRAGESGSLPDDDSLPVTLLTLLSRVMPHWMSVLADGGKVLDQWAVDKAPGAAVPRKVGDHTIRLQGVETDRVVLSYPLWRLQRIRDEWLALEGSQRAEADRFLEGIGALACLLAPPATRLVRKHNRLYIADPDADADGIDG